MYRTFTLRNEKGEEYPLSSPDFYKYGFLTEPDGLGIDIKNTYVKLGETFLQTDSDIQQGEFEGTMLFPSYSVYRQFANFIFSATSLTLLYNYEGAPGTYHRQCVVNELEKGEMNENGILECSLSLELSTLYYLENQVNYYVVASEIDRRYSIPYPNRYKDFEALNIVLHNDGHIPAAFACTIWGYIENPNVRIVALNGWNRYNITFPVTLQVGECVRYSSQDGNSYVQRVDSSGTVTNLLPMLSITRNNFIRIPKGYHRLYFGGDTPVTNNISYTMYKYYKAV